MTEVELRTAAEIIRVSPHYNKPQVMRSYDFGIISVKGFFTNYGYMIANLYELSYFSCRDITIDS